MKPNLVIVLRHLPKRKRFLLRALDTIRSQTLQPSRIIVLNMDSSAGIKSADLSSDSLSILFANDKSSLQQALKRAEADHICFLDDDDTWAPEFLSRLLSLISKTGEEYNSIKAICSHSNRVDEISEGNRIIINTTHPWNHHVNPGPLHLDQVYYKNSIPISSCIFKMNELLEVIENHDASDPSFFWPFLIDFLSKHDMWVVPEAMCFYHFREPDDYQYGNFTSISSDKNSFSFTLKINQMLRFNSGNDLLLRMLSNLINSDNYFKLKNVENILNERKN